MGWPGSGKVCARAEPTLAAASVAARNRRLFIGGERIGTTHRRCGAAGAPRGHEADVGRGWTASIAPTTTNGSSHARPFAARPAGAGAPAGARPIGGLGRAEIRACRNSPGEGQVAKATHWA